jgi:hypothetical protein
LELLSFFLGGGIFHILELYHFLELVSFWGIFFVIFFADKLGRGISFRNICKKIGKKCYTYL